MQGFQRGPMTSISTSVPSTIWSGNYKPASQQSDSEENIEPVCPPYSACHRAILENQKALKKLGGFEFLMKIETVITYFNCFLQKH